MRSHTYQFGIRDLPRLLLGPVGVAVGFIALLHLGARIGVLPAPRPTVDTDRTVLIHQADASRKANDAGILLLGDSSCLMGVSASLLSEKLKQPALNLATLSFLDAGANALLLREYAAANPGKLRCVVLLMHPEALRRIGAESFHEAALTNYLGRTDHVTDQLTGWLAVDLFKGRVLARLVPIPLPGTFGRTYGFSRDLDAFMTGQRGGLYELDSAAIAGSTEYRLSPTLQAGAKAFASTLPSGTKLLVGLTPVPAKLAGADFPETRRNILRQWSEWLGADAVLDDLPATLPDEAFARSTHLKPDAVPGYTETLARAVKRHLQ